MMAAVSTEPAKAKRNPFFMYSKLVVSNEVKNKVQNALTQVPMPSAFQHDKNCGLTVLTLHI
jgi:hypothetical protein